MNVKKNKNVVLSLILCAPLVMGACTFVSDDQYETLRDNPATGPCFQSAKKSFNRSFELATKVDGGWEMSDAYFKKVKECIEEQNPDVEVEGVPDKQSGNWFALFLAALIGFGGGADGTGGSGGTSGASGT